MEILASTASRSQALDLLKLRCFVFGEWRESWPLTFHHFDHEPSKMVKGSDLHSLEVGVPGADLLCGFPRERHERNLTQACNSTSHGAPGLCDHRVRLAGSGTSDDKGAIRQQARVENGLRGGTITTFSVPVAPTRS